MLIQRPLLRSLGLAAALVSSITLATPLSPPSLPAHAAEPATLPKGKSDDDFATQILSDPWDMSGPEDLAFEITRDKGLVSNLRFENGDLIATSTTNDPRIYLQVPSHGLLNAVPGEGGYQPINADIFRYLTVRLFVPRPNNEFDFVQVLWLKDDSQEWAANPGTTNPFPPQQYGLMARNGWQSITFDLKAMAKDADRPWQGQIQGLMLDPTTRPNIEFKIDFVQLSANPPSIPISIGGSGDLMISRAGRGDEERIVKDYSGSYSWPVGLAAGSYEVYTTSDPTTKEALLIDTTPQLTITAPSYTSGPEFATEVRGNPWDMNDEGDIDRTNGLSSSSFANGIFSATSSDFGTQNPCMTLNDGTKVYCGDPGVFLHWKNESNRIDTSRYKYLTYRMRLDGKIDTLYGSVGRVIWTSSSLDKSSTSKDWVVYEDWQTVSFDLSKMKLEPDSTASWSQSRPWILRFDPHEFAAPRRFEIDYVMLTGDDRADRSFDIRYEARDAEGSPMSVQFFYTTVQGTWSGGTPITCVNTVASAGPDTQQANRHYAYIPLLSGGGTASPIPRIGTACRWNTAAVPAGTYYIYGIVTDGTNQRFASSQTAVVVSH